MSRRARDLRLIAIGAAIGAIAVWWLVPRSPDEVPRERSKEIARAPEREPQIDEGPAAPERIEPQRERTRTIIVVPPGSRPAPQHAEPAPVEPQPEPDTEEADAPAPAPADSQRAPPEATGDTTAVAALITGVRVFARWEGPISEIDEARRRALERDVNCRSAQLIDFELDADRLAGVLVYLENPPTLPRHPPARVAELKMHDCRFEPNVLALQLGQRLDVINEDPFLHSFDAAAKPRGVSLALPGGKRSSPRFHAPHLGIPVRNHVRSFMTATLHVLDHPFFAVTNRAGTAELFNVPPGDYTLVALHPKLPPQRRTIHFDGTAVLEETFTFSNPTHTARLSSSSSQIGIP